MEQVTGYVAFLDVLGFTDLIARDERLDVVGRYVRAVKAAVPTARVTNGLRMVLFSDSIIISTKGDDPDALPPLLEACSRVFGALLGLEVPVRGAIAYGRFIRSVPGEGAAIVAGRPIIEALQWEREQDWVGISLAPSVLRRISGLEERCASRTIGSESDLDDLSNRLPWVAHLLMYSHIPFHAESPSEPHTVVGFAVIPLDPTMRTVEDIVPGCDRLTDHAMRMLLLGPDPRCQQSASGSRSSWATLRASGTISCVATS